MDASEAPDASEAAAASAAPITPGERRFLDLAVRAAARRHGHVEPNPCVGCVIADEAGRFAALGVHRAFGGPHAEAEALAIAGPRARGGTAIVTLEPCDHQGQQPPCSRALVRAGLARVVFAVADPNPEAAGGARRLRNAGIVVVHAAGHEAAERLAAPFVHRIRTGRPWVVAKWAQTVDGRIATRDGHSQWISGDRSRRMVHRQRGRSDVVLTGVGTVLADDPELTPRHGRIRRMPLRVVADSAARTPTTSRLLRTVAAGPVVIAVQAAALERDDVRQRAQRLEAAGAEILPVPGSAPPDRTSLADPRLPPGQGPGRLDLEALLRQLAGRDAATVLVEAGGVLLGHLFARELVQEAWVFTGPRLLGDGAARSAVEGHEPSRIDAGVAMELLDVRRRGGDTVARWRVGRPVAGGDSRTPSR